MYQLDFSVALCLTLDIFAITYDTKCQDLTLCRTYIDQSRLTIRTYLRDSQKLYEVYLDGITASMVSCYAHMFIFYLEFWDSPVTAVTQ